RSDKLRATAQVHPPISRQVAQNLSPSGEACPARKLGHAMRAIALIQGHVILSPASGLTINCFQTLSEANMNNCFRNKLECCSGQLQSKAEVSIVKVLQRFIDPIQGLPEPALYADGPTARMC